MYQFTSAITRIPVLIAWLFAAIHLVFVLESYSILSKALVLQFDIPMEAISHIPDEALSSNTGRDYFLQILRLLAVQGLLSAVYLFLWLCVLVNQILSFGSTKGREAT
jgi:hypothetical protein